MELVLDGSSTVKLVSKDRLVNRSQVQYRYCDVTEDDRSFGGTDYKASK